MKCSCCGQELTKADRFCPNCAENNEYYEFLVSEKITNSFRSVQRESANYSQSQTINVTTKNSRTNNEQILTTISYFSNADKVKIWLESEKLVVSETNYNDIVILVKNFIDNLIKNNLEKYNYETTKIDDLLRTINSKCSWEEYSSTSNTLISKIISLFNDIVYHKSLDKFIDNVLKNQKIVIESVKLFIENNNIANAINIKDNSKTIDNVILIEKTTEDVNSKSRKNISKDKLMSKSGLQKIYNKLSTYGFKGFVHAGDYLTVKQILKTNKVLSREEALGKFRDIANQEIIANTSEFVKSKVRFYYAPNTPAYYHFDKKSSQFVILQFDYSLVEDYEVYFLDGNAASEYSKISQNAAEIVGFDWYTIFGRGPIYSDEDKIDIIRKRDAELLVKGPVLVDKYIKKIIVKNENVANKIKLDFPKYSKIVIVDPQSFN